MSFFSASNITAGYGGRHVLERVSFEAESGCITGIIGANGSGKTTLLKAICGILPHQGYCLLDGVKTEGFSAKQMARQCGYIPQRSGIAIDISVLDAVLMGFNPRLRLLEHPTAEMKRCAASALDRVGLAGREEENYQHLSEGQKQLCMLARALVSDSRLLLLDEPESALDFRFRYRMLALLDDWVHEEERAAIVALHDPALALRFCDRLILLDEGRVLGSIGPKKDSLADMEQMLCRIYGSVSLQRCVSRSGRENLVMLKEDEG